MTLSLKSSLKAAYLFPLEMSSPLYLHEAFFFPPRKLLLFLKGCYCRKCFFSYTSFLWWFTQKSNSVDNFWPQFFLLLKRTAANTLSWISTETSALSSNCLTNLPPSFTIYSAMFSRCTPNLFAKEAHSNHLVFWALFSSFLPQQGEHYLPSSGWIFIFTSNIKTSQKVSKHIA